MIQLNVSLDSSGRARLDGKEHELLLGVLLLRNPARVQPDNRHRLPATALQRLPGRQSLPPRPQRAKAICIWRITTTAARCPL